MGATIKDEISTEEQKLCPNRSPLPILDYAYVGSKALVILISCLLLFLLFLEVLFWSCCIVSSFVIILMRKRELVALL